MPMLERVTTCLVRSLVLVSRTTPPPPPSTSSSQQNGADSSLFLDVTLNPKPQIPNPNPQTMKPCRLLQVASDNHGAAALPHLDAPDDASRLLGGMAKELQKESCKRPILL